MTPAGEPSRSLAIYSLLLRLYPAQYLRQHRAEMLQNFLDIEATASSGISLWAFIGKDLLVSLRAQLRRTFWAQTTVIFTVLAVLALAARRYPITKEHCIWGCCLGYVAGWLGGWFGKRWQTDSISESWRWARSFSCQSAVVLVALVFVVCIARALPVNFEHVLWAAAYGSLLGWSAGWCGKRLQARL